jgi:nitroimidazol reductase NimA-like FMN-containing flavoprotein (pyridoxamine 5'-phosphate oxidase superfamily)
MPENMKEVRSFMDRERLASIATVDARNQPHVVPVFFTYENGKVYVQTDRNSAKVRNLLSNDCVAVAVYNEEEAVIIRGRGRVLESDEEFIRRTQEHIDKYMLKLDEHGRDSLGIPLFDKKVRCVIEVTSKRIVFW